jgi:hypothetical protein
MKNSGISKLGPSVFVFVMLMLSYARSQEPMTATKSGSADVLRDQIVTQERAGLDVLKTGELAPFDASIAEEAVFVDAHGPATKAEVVEHTAAFRLHDYSMADVRFVRLGAESGLIAYSLTECGTSHGHEFSAHVYVSAIWAKRDGKWQCLFSQETGAR